MNDVLHNIMARRGTIQWMLSRDVHANLIGMVSKCEPESDGPKEEQWISNSPEEGDWLDDATYHGGI